MLDTKVTGSHHTEPCPSRLFGSLVDYFIVIETLFRQGNSQDTKPKDPG